MLPARSTISRVAISRVRVAISRVAISRVRIAISRVPIYVASQEHPDNAQVRKAITDGVPNTTIFKRQTPVDAIEYFICVHNSCHDNGGHSWVQLLEDSYKLGASWILHALAKNITGAQFGYTGPTGLPAQ